MSKAEAEKRVEMKFPQKTIVLFIDDDIQAIIDKFSDISSEANDLEARFYDPRKPFSLSDQEIENIGLIVADQFFNRWSKIHNVQQILDTIREKNPSIEVIETSYLPSTNFSFKGSLGAIDTIDLLNLEYFNKPKTALAFVEKLKWNSNYAFREAKRIEGIDESDDAFIDAFSKLIDNFAQLTDDAHYQNLLALLGVSEEEFAYSFMSNNIISRRKNFLHASWQIVGHLMFKHGEEFYSMPLQRLKGLIDDSLNLNNNG